MAALEKLEQLLDLADGTLTDLVEQRAMPAVQPPATPPAGSTLPWAPGLEVLEHLESTAHDQFHELSCHVEADIGTDRLPHRQRYRVLFQARRGRISEVPLVEVTEIVSDEPPTTTPISGCRVGRTHHHASRHAFGAVLELDHPITPPETTLIEFEVNYPPGFRQSMLASHATTRPHSEILVWVRFRHQDPPSWVERFSIRDEAETAELISLQGTSAHAAWHSDGPGEFGIRWGW